MDFSWVKDLADEANRSEVARQEKLRKEKEKQRQLALATCPFVEKLYVLVGTCTEEFNKHCMFPHLRVATTRLVKRSRAGTDAANDPNVQLEEVAYFTFTRGGWLYGIRGNNGVVEFVEFPVSEGMGTVNIKLDELGVTATYRMQAVMDENGEITWMMNDTVMDGAEIIRICQRYFSEFIGKTNE